MDIRTPRHAGSKPSLPLTRCCTLKVLFVARERRRLAGFLLHVKRALAGTARFWVRVDDASLGISIPRMEGA